MGLETGFRARLSHPAGADYPSLARRSATVLGGEPEHESGDVSGREPNREALGCVEGGEHLGGDEAAALALGHDPTGNDAVHADSGGAELAGQSARQSLDADLGGKVGGEVDEVRVRAHRSEVDDRAAAVGSHGGRNRLCGEEVRPEIGGHGIVPVAHRHLAARHPPVVGGVVDEHGDGTKGGLDAPERISQRGDVADVGDEGKRGRKAAACEVVAPLAGLGRCDVDEGTADPWAQKWAMIDAPIPVAPPVTATTRSDWLG